MATFSPRNSGVRFVDTWTHYFFADAELWIPQVFQRIPFLADTPWFLSVHDKVALS